MLLGLLLDVPPSATLSGSAAIVAIVAFITDLQTGWHSLPAQKKLVTSERPNDELKGTKPVVMRQTRPFAAGRW